MALYISPARRRMHAVRIVAAALVVGSGIGVVAGRFLATTPADAARQVRLDGASLAVNVDRLGIEYEELLRTGKDTGDGGITDELNVVQKNFEALFRRAPWLSDDGKLPVQTALNAVRSAVKARVPVEQFQGATDAATVVLRTTFGA